MFKMILVIQHVCKHINKYEVPEDRASNIDDLTKEIEIEERKLCDNCQNEKDIKHFDLISH